MIKQLTAIQIKKFRKMVYGYSRLHGRNELSWRKTLNPYRILVSEMMLQQTQVSRVMTKYREFVRRFPTIRAVARAPLRKVLKTWSGLGYNRRALALKRAAEIIVTCYKGRIPRDRESLVRLPGIGETTASAIRVFSFNLPAVFIETNIRTVFIHFFGRRRKMINDKELLPLIEQTRDTRNPRRWFYALMDYGAMLKKRYPNPSRRSAHHTKQSRFQGSNREARGTIVKALTRGSVTLKERLTLRERLTLKQLRVRTGLSVRRLRTALSELRKDGLVTQQGSKWCIE
jgi:A/G-specific adenine glycosylase